MTKCRAGFATGLDIDKIGQNHCCFPIKSNSDEVIMIVHFYQSKYFELRALEFSVVFFIKHPRKQHVGKTTICRDNE